MGFFETASILLTLAALFSYVNFKYLHLPTTIGVMMISLAASLVILALDAMHLPVGNKVTGIVAGIDFSKAIFHGMLAFLLFATFIAHFGAALMHALIYRDGVFQSMASWKKRSGRFAVAKQG